MAPFEQLQELWQQQPPPAPAVDAVAVSRALGRYGRRQRAILTIKLALILVLVPWTIVRSQPSGWMVAGIAILLAQIAVLVRIDWRNQRAVSRLDFAEPSAAFVRRAIGILMEHREPFRKHFWPFLISITLATNLMVYGVRDHVTFRWQVGGHLLATLFPWLAYYAGVAVRIRRFENECRPLVERLTAMQRALEAQPE